MNSNHPVLAPEKQHRDWLPFLEFATREVFEMMLASQLTSLKSSPLRASTLPPSWDLSAN
jgi:hypothetical protein